MEQYIQYYEQSQNDFLAAGGRARINVRASGFKLITGEVDVQFWLSGRVVGEAKKLQPGDAIFGVEFDSVEVRPTQNQLYGASWYISTAEFSTDRVQNTVATKRSVEGMREVKGYQKAFEQTPTSAAIAWCAGVWVVPVTAGDQKIALIDTLYASRRSMLVFGSLPAGVAQTGRPVSAIHVNYANALTSGNDAQGITVAGEVAKLSATRPPALVIEGRVKLENPIILYDGFGLYLQDDEPVVGEAIYFDISWIETNRY